MAFTEPSQSEYRLQGLLIHSPLGLIRNSGTHENAHFLNKFLISRVPDFTRVQGLAINQHSLQSEVSKGLQARVIGNRCEMKTESARTHRSVYGIRMLGGSTVALVFALGCAACLREGIEAACIGMVFPAIVSGVPYLALERMCRNDRLSQTSRHIILGGAAIMSLPAWWAYTMGFMEPDAQGGLVFLFIPALQLAGCAVLALASGRDT